MIGGVPIRKAVTAAWVGLIVGLPLAAAPQQSTWTLPGGRGVLQALAGDSAVADAALAALERQGSLPGLPDYLPRGVTLQFADTPEEFSALAGGRVPEWSAGLAIPAESRIVIPLFRAPGRSRRDATSRVLRHEWAHLGLHQYLEPLRIPRWFSEGYAQWASGWNRGDVWRLRVLVALGRTPSLNSLSLRFPVEAGSAEVAYLLSATMVEYLVDTSGEEGLEIFLARWKEVGRFDEALARTYGFTPGRLESAWQRWMKERYGVIHVFSSSGLGWGMLAALLLLLFRIRRRRDREAMARLRAGDVPPAPSYWLGDPGSSIIVTPGAAGNVNPGEIEAPPNRQLPPDDPR